ncbi:MAG: diadenylate cyclase CdaA [Clostridia bacterium]|nr:diadenylate cyclase CdaA [Clostridia bacterium]
MTLSDFWSLIKSYISEIGIMDIVDILVVSVVLYYLIRFLREQRAAKLLTGLLVLVVLAPLSAWFGMDVVHFLLTNTLQLGLIALVIVFQPELRSALEQLGSIRRLGFSVNGEENAVQEKLQAICQGIASLSAQRVGALLVFERGTRLGDVIKTGTLLNADPSERILRTIFYDGTALHDGAVVVRDMKLLAAGCWLPMTAHQDSISRDLGTRHRAAVGMSEASDAIVVIVSEETGTISVAERGKLERNFTQQTLQAYLMRELHVEQGRSHRFRAAFKREEEGDETHE